MSFKFNGGMGAAVCDPSAIIKSGITQQEYDEEYPTRCLCDVCLEKLDIDGWPDRDRYGGWN